VTGPAAPRDLTCDEVREVAAAFVLGALEPADDAAVRAHLASCPESHDEMAELGGVLPALAEAVPQVEPPVALKSRIMAAAAAELATRQADAPAVDSSASVPVGATATPTVPTAAAGPTAATAAPTGPAGPMATPTVPTAFPTEDERTERAARRERTSPLAWVLRIAAVVAIVALLGWNVLLQGQLNTAKGYEAGVAAVLDAASQPGSLVAVLTADGGTGSGLAAISATGDVTMAMRDLAPTTGNAVYEAWVIGGDGVPVPIGSFKVGTAGTATFETAGVPPADGVVLALTLEPGPGATAPTAPTISKGVATAAG
jgi:anti-sigma-K factor RskA